MAAINLDSLGVGSTLLNGKYRIEANLGQGGFGITYLAKHLLLDKRVAIKEFFPSDYCGRDADTSHVSLGTTTDLEFVSRLRKKFLTEARNIAKLNHDNIVKISDVFEENDTAYYVMDFVDGQSLDSIVKKQGTLPADKALRYIRGVAQALKSMHDSHIMHLDIKPANIMVRQSDDTPVLIDFGLSKEYSAAGDSKSVPLSAVSHGYSPLEQYSSDGIKTFSPQTDIYALGGTLYKLVTGKAPTEASKRMDLGLPMPDSLDPRVVELIEETMAMSRQKRPESADKVIAMIDSILQSAPAESAPAPTAKPRKAPENATTIIAPKGGSGGSASSGKKGIIIAAVCLVVAGAVAFMLLGRGGSDPAPAATDVAPADSIEAPVVDVAAGVAEPAASVKSKTEAPAASEAAQQPAAPAASEPAQQQASAAPVTEPVQQQTSAAPAQQQPANPAPAAPAANQAEEKVKAVAKDVVCDNMDMGMNVVSCNVADKALVFTVRLSSNVYEERDCYPANPVFRDAVNGWVARTPSASAAIGVAKQNGYGVRFRFNGAKSFNIAY